MLVNRTASIAARSWVVSNNEARKPFRLLGELVIVSAALFFPAAVFVAFLGA